jgi:hypothetical protein
VRKLLPRDASRLPRRRSSDAMSDHPGRPRVGVEHGGYPCRRARYPAGLGDGSPTVHGSDQVCDIRCRGQVPRKVGGATERLRAALVRSKSSIPGPRSQTTVSVFGEPGGRIVVVGQQGDRYGSAAAGSAKRVPVGGVLSGSRTSSFRTSISPWTSWRRRRGGRCSTLRLKKASCHLTASIQRTRATTFAGEPRRSLHRPTTSARSQGPGP